MLIVAPNIPTTEVILPCGIEGIAFTPKNMRPKPNLNNHEPTSENVGLWVNCISQQGTFSYTAIRIHSI